MSFLDKLFGKVDPTRDWIQERMLTLKLNLSESALCGVKIGEPFEKLSMLGPTEDAKAAGSGELRYFTKGLSVSTDSGKITCYRLTWEDDLGEGFRPFIGTFSYGGAPVSLGIQTRAEDILEYFGEPYWRDEDEDEVILFYEPGEIEWQLELNRQGRLKSILVLTPPLLADEKQRKSYNVTKPWPPEKKT